MKTKFSLFIIMAFIIKSNLHAQDEIPAAANDGGTEVKYNGWALNSIFNIPILRYNILSFKGDGDKIGTLESFNSVGAGISISFGNIRVNSNWENDTDIETEIEMKNIIGFSLGFLFSKTDSIGGARIIFSPTMGVQILDFQIGTGYELGTVENKAHRWLFTISYGIPLSKLTDKGSYLITSPQKFKQLKNKNVNRFF